jgi:hypothetical protein
MLFQDGTYYKNSREVFNYGERWEYGYVVGIGSLGYISKNSNWTDEFLASVIVGLPHNTLFGIWTDEIDVFIDLVKHVDSYAEAMRIARENNERAIYNLRTHTCEFVDY